jgi:hypothetical protein
MLGSNQESIATLPPFGPHRGKQVVWPDFQSVSGPEEPVCIHLFRQNPVFTSLHLKYPVHVAAPPDSCDFGIGCQTLTHWTLTTRVDLIHIRLDLISSDTVTCVGKRCSWAGGSRRTRCWGRFTSWPPTSPAPSGSTRRQSRTHFQIFA